MNLSKLWGKHLLTMGFSLDTNNIDETILSNTITFSTSQRREPENLGHTGSDLASFLLGVPSAGTRRLQGGGENQAGWTVSTSATNGKRLPV